MQYFHRTERKQIIIKDKLCFVCLRLGHSAKRTINVLNVTVDTITRFGPLFPKLPLIEVDKSIFVKIVIL